KPCEVEPVADLPFHVAPARLTGAVPERARVVIGLQRDDVADGAVVNAPHRLALGRLIPVAQSGHDTEIVAPRFFTSRQHATHARSVHRYRLFGEDVLPRPHSRLDVNGAKMWRCT